MSVSSSKIFRLILENRSKGLTSNEILAGIKIKKSKKSVLRKALSKLLKQKSITKMNNRYFPENSGASKEQKIKFRKRASDLSGIFFRDLENPQIFSGDGKTFSVDKKQAEAMFHGDEVIFTASPDSGVRLLSITARSFKTISGTIVRDNEEASFIPELAKFGNKFEVSNPEFAKATSGFDFYEARILEYPSARKPGICRLCKPVKKEGPHWSHRFQKRITEDFELPSAFPPKVKDQISSFPTRVVFQPDSNRADLRKIPFITVDGADAKDFDDAIFVEKDSAGYRLYVAIADVAKYVPSGSALDKEAFLRGNSVYFPDRCIPMLPEELSNNLCSLVPHKNRNAMVCELTIDFSGNAISGKLYPGMIRSHSRMTYEKLNHFLETETWPKISSIPDFEQRIKTAIELSRVLRKKRKLRGTIDFNFPDTRFEFKDAMPEKMFSVHETAAHKMIEQFMLEANEFVADFCFRKKIPVFWRNHPNPPRGEIKNLHQRLLFCGVSRETLKKSRSIQDLPELLEEEPCKEEALLLILRSMQKAFYGEKNLGHFGLAASRYCHFTSPIRRYADLFLHQNLWHFLEKKPLLQNKSDRGILISTRERNAEAAERESRKCFSALFLRPQIGEKFSCRIKGFHRGVLFIESKMPPFEGLVPPESLKDDFYQYDPDSLRLIGKRTAKEIRIGDSCLGMITRVEIEKGKVWMKILNLESPPRKEPGRPPKTKRKKSGSDSRKPSSKKIRRKFRAIRR